jgi:hypothetical protein
MLKRSFSTPDTAQLQKQAAEDSQGQNMSAGEKKRNKLGYHRTSIACSTLVLATYFSSCELRMC